MRRDGRSGPSEDRSEYILPNYSTFGIMNTVGNLFHQIEDWGDLRGPKDRPDDLSTDCNFLAINWSFNGGAQCLFWHGGGQNAQRFEQIRGQSDDLLSGGHESICHPLHLLFHETSFHDLWWGLSVCQTKKVLLYTVLLTSEKKVQFGRSLTVVCLLKS